MPTFLFYPRRADGVSLTFIADAAADDRDALDRAEDIAGAHGCASVFVYESLPTGEERLVGEVRRKGAARVKSNAESLSA
ncbi:hypothetical protein E1H18_487 [Caulobacter sp. RHG1]|nr:hypothetical protein [Caulobacter sp. RHG1]